MTDCEQLLSSIYPLLTSPAHLIPYGDFLAYLAAGTITPSHQPSIIKVLHLSSVWNGDRPGISEVGPCYWCGSVVGSGRPSLWCFPSARRGAREIRII